MFRIEFAANNDLRINTDTQAYTKFYDNFKYIARVSDTWKIAIGSL